MADIYFVIYTSSRFIEECRKVHLFDDRSDDELKKLFNLIEADSDEFIEFMPCEIKNRYTFAKVSELKNTLTTDDFDDDADDEAIVEYLAECTDCMTYDKDGEEWIVYKEEG